MSNTASATNTQILMRVPSFLLWTYPTRYRPIATLPDVVGLCAFAPDAEARTLGRLLNTTATVTPGSHDLSSGEQVDGSMPSDVVCCGRPRNCNVLGIGSDIGASAL